LKLPINQIKNSITLVEQITKINDITIRPNSYKEKVLIYGNVKRKIKMHINLSGFEYGSLFNFSFPTDRSLVSIKVPILASEVTALVKLNIYSTRNNQPEKLIKSKTFSITKNSKDIFWDLSATSEAIIVRNEGLLFSIEFIGYEMMKETALQSTSAKKNGLTVFSTTENVAIKGFLRGKLSNNVWTETTPVANGKSEPPLKLVVLTYFSD
jgi:hypothetical protein